MTDIEFLDDLERRAKRAIYKDGPTALFAMSREEYARFREVRSMPAGPHFEYLLAKFIIDQVPIVRAELLRQAVRRLTS